MTPASDPPRNDTAALDAPCYEATLPLGWTPLDAAPGSLRLGQWADEDLRVLAAVALLDDSRGSHAAPDDGHPLDAEIARLHQKLNLLIDLVGTLAAGQGGALPLARLRLSWQGAVFVGSAALGAHGLLALGLHRSVPEPFRWPATIIRIDGEERHARFDPLPEAVQAALERHVFLRHRRAIAGSRKPGPH